MKLLKQKLKTTYEYVLDLKERLSDTCELAQKELHKVQTKQAKYFNRNTEDRIFQAGDEILVLLPTNSNKLLLQWKGPFQVIERIREMTTKFSWLEEQKLFMQTC